MHQILNFPSTSPGLVCFPKVLHAKPVALILTLFELLTDAIGEQGLKPTASNIGEGFMMATVVDTMKNTILDIAVTQRGTDVGCVLAQVRPRASCSPSIITGFRATKGQAMICKRIARIVKRPCCSLRYESLDSIRPFDDACGGGPATPL